MNPYFKKWYEAMMSDQAAKEKYLESKRRRSREYYRKKVLSE